MTVSGWCILGLTVCVTIRAGYGLIQLIDDCKVGAGPRASASGRVRMRHGQTAKASPDTFPAEWTRRPYDRETDVA